jgi:lipopolysaccharide biosynthesis regulator YciM
MKLISFISGVIVLAILAGCSGPKIVAPRVPDNILAENAAAKGNHAKAVELWKAYFGEQTLAQITGADFAQAAQSAYKTGDSKLAVNWFDQARYKNFADVEMYATLAKIYNSQQNISKELSSLEYIMANYPEKSSQISERLFLIYHEIGEPSKALSSWTSMEKSEKDKLSNLLLFYQIQYELKDSVACDSLSLVILEKQPENVEALEWNAFKYYWQGENRYQREMEIYNKNKTNKQYKILLKELDLSTADFKKSLTYLEKLWAIQPGEKYASYFMNIYARFTDETKVNYYKKYLK